jgi:hypothetical protein
MWFCGKDPNTNKCSIGYAQSLDGISWDADALPVIYPGTQGDWDLHRYPGSIIRVNDTLKMWFIGSEDNAFAYAIGYAYYSEDSAKWILHPVPVLEKGEPGTWDAALVSRPSVIYDGQTYHMWYFGWEGGLITNPALIGYAASQDGINWIKDTLNNPVTSPGPPGSFYDVWAYGPTVIDYEDTLRMYFAGWDGTNSSPFKYIRIGYATSLDGINWEVQNNDEPVLDVGIQDEWDEDWVRYCSVLIHENRLKMWYDGTRDTGSQLKIGYANGDTLVGITEQTSDLIPAVYPNPGAGAMNLRFTLHVSQFIGIDLYSVSGKMIRQLVNERMIPGIYEIDVDMSDLPGGIYFLRLKTNDGIKTEKLIKL